jgi:hypothetical protein
LKSDTDVTDVEAVDEGNPTPPSSFKKWFNRVVQVGIVGVLVYQLTQVGWVEVLRSLPTNPLFYLLQFAIYMALPISELFIYKKPWNFKIRQGLPIFIYKKIYNSDVITYSGEVYLYYWAKKNFNQTKKEIVAVIRDNNILSTVSSTMIAVLLIGVFLTFGHIGFNDIIGREGRIWLPWILLVVAILGAIAWHYRRLWFSLSRREALYILSVHTLRLLAVHALELLQWVVAIPVVSITSWFSLMAAKIATSRIPLLPNKDLIFVSIVIGLSGTFGIPQAELASMLLVSSVMNKLINLGFFAWLSWKPSLKEEVSVPAAEEVDIDTKIDFGVDRYKQLP